jgi:hypothetical protein
VVIKECMGDIDTPVMRRELDSWYGEKLHIF